MKEIIESEGRQTQRAYASIYRELKAMLEKVPEPTQGVIDAGQNVTVDEAGDSLEYLQHRMAAIEQHVVRGLIRYAYYDGLKAGYLNKRAVPNNESEKSNEQRT